jgi:hypothetical protein
MENDKCLLCGSPATSGPFSPEPENTKMAGGWKYACGTCGLYALSMHELHYIESYCSQGQCLQLSEYVKDHPDKEGNYKILTMAEIRQVLNLPDKPKS